MEIEVFKCIFSGHFFFGKERSYNQVLEQYENRVVNHYRNLVALKTEEVFNEEELAIVVWPRLIVNISKKQWNNTVQLLKFAAGYAVAGKFHAHMIKDGQLLDQHVIEPDSEKVAVQAFRKGRELGYQEGQETEAFKALDKAIKRYEKHALAYERRGYIQVRLQNYDDAIRDFTKSISSNPDIPEPYIGRATAYMKQEKWTEARNDLKTATTKCIPHDPIYWKAIRMKAEVELKLGEYESVKKDLKRFTSRGFNEENPNYKYRKLAFTNYGIAMMETDEYKNAIEAFNQAADIPDGKRVHPADPLFYRGLAKQKAGKRDYKKDLKQAAELGSERAAELLAKK